MWMPNFLDLPKCPHWSCSPFWHLFFQGERAMPLLHPRAWLGFHTRRAETQTPTLSSLFYFNHNNQPSSSAPTPPLWYAPCRKLHLPSWAFFFLVNILPSSRDLPSRAFLSTLKGDIPKTFGQLMGALMGASFISWGPWETGWNLHNLWGDGRTGPYIYMGGAHPWEDHAPSSLFLRGNIRTEHTWNQVFIWNTHITWNIIQVLEPSPSLLNGWANVENTIPSQSSWSIFQAFLKRP